MKKTFGVVITIVALIAIILVGVYLLPSNTQQSFFTSNSGHASTILYDYTDALGLIQMNLDQSRITQQAIFTRPDYNPLDKIQAQFVAEGIDVSKADRISVTIQDINSNTLFTQSYSISTSGVTRTTSTITANLAFTAPSKRGTYKIFYKILDKNNNVLKQESKQFSVYGGIETVSFTTQRGTVGSQPSDIDRIVQNIYEQGILDEKEPDNFATLDAWKAQPDNFAKLDAYKAQLTKTTPPTPSNPVTAQKSTSFSCESYRLFTLFGSEVYLPNWLSGTPTSCYEVTSVGKQSGQESNPVAPNIIKKTTIPQSQTNQYVAAVAGSPPDLTLLNKCLAKPSLPECKPEATDPSRVSFCTKDICLSGDKQSFAELHGQLQIKTCYSHDKDCNAIKKSEEYIMFCDTGFNYPGTVGSVGPWSETTGACQKPECTGDSCGGVTCENGFTELAGQCVCASPKEIVGEKCQTVVTPPTPPPLPPTPKEIPCAKYQSLAHDSTTPYCKFDINELLNNYPTELIAGAGFLMVIILLLVVFSAQRRQ